MMRKHRNKSIFMIYFKIMSLQFYSATINHTRSQTLTLTLDLWSLICKWYIWSSQFKLFTKRWCLQIKQKYINCRNKSKTCQIREMRSEKRKSEYPVSSNEKVIFPILISWLWTIFTRQMFYLSPAAKIVKWKQRKFGPAWGRWRGNLETCSCLKWNQSFLWM